MPLKQTSCLLSVKASKHGVCRHTPLQAQLKQSSAVADDDAHGVDSASERDAVQEELRSLQLQILQGQGGGGGGGNSPAKQLRASLDSRGQWRDRACLAQELRASAVGASCAHTSVAWLRSCQGSCFVLRAVAVLQQRTLQ